MSLVDLVVKVGDEKNKHANHVLAREIELLWERIKDISDKLEG